LSEEGGFVEEMPEDFYAAEELELGRLSKCKGLGKKQKKKTADRVLEGEGAGPE